MRNPLQQSLPFCLALLSLVAVGLGGDAVRAQGTPRGDDFQVNAYTTSFQVFAAATADAEGEFVVGWSSQGSWGNDTSYTSVQARPFDRWGAATGAQLQVNTFTPMLQGPAALAGLPGGGVLVAWTSLGSDLGDTQSNSVQARLLDAAGQPAGDPFLVNVGTTGSQCCVALAELAGGEIVAVWGSDVSAGSDSSGSSVQARLFDAAGAPLTGEIQVNAWTTAGQASPAVAADPAGGFVVAWESSGSYGDDTSYSSIQVRRFDVAGTPEAADFQVNTYTPMTQRRARVAVAPDRRFLVAWESSGSGEGDIDNLSVHARAFDPAGAPLGPQFQVNTYTTGAQERPAVAADSRGFVVVWQSAGSFGTDTDSASIQARNYDPSGTPLSDELQVNTYTTGLQSAPAVAADRYGDLVIAWHGNGSAGTDTASTSIQARLFDAILRDGFETGDTSRWSATQP